MKKKLLNFALNNKQLCLTSSIVIIVGIICIIIYFTLTNNLITKNYNSNNFSFSYDKSWFVTSFNSNAVTLKHESNTIDIKIKENINETLESILDKTLWTIGKTNENYKLISKYKILATINNYDGYRLIYENDNSHTLLILGKKGDCFFTVTYTASNESFDLLYDSANYIINSLTLKNESFEIDDLVDIKLSNIKWNDNLDLIIDEDEVNNYEINANNYNIKYTLSTSFIPLKNNYKCDNLKTGSILANVSIKNINTYEYLDKENQDSLYYTMKKYSDDKTYNSYKSQTSRIESLSDDYIFKASYKKDNDFYEEVQVILTIDNTHILLVQINSTNAYIPKELVQGIKIIK